MRRLAKTMEHVTTTWKTTLAPVLMSLQAKTVKVCLHNLYLFISFSQHVRAEFVPCNISLYHERATS